MGHVQNCHLYIRYRNNLKITTMEQFKALQANHLLFSCKNYTLSLSDLRISSTNILIFFVIVLLPFFSIMHKLKLQGMYAGVHTKRLLYCWRCCFFGAEQCMSYSWWAMAPNMHPGHFLALHFLHTFKHTLNIIGRIWMFYILNNWCTIGDVHFLV